jgi:hypothetical protein
MWYALMDHQYTKETFMQQPVLYKLGIENKSFGP